MALGNQLEREGLWLFRWRSLLPLVFLPLLVMSMMGGNLIEKYFGQTAETFWTLGCLLVSYLGLGIRCWVTGHAPGGTSGRTTKEQYANVLNTTGLYSIVRNPLYLGNYLMILGVALLTQSWWFVVILSLAYILYYERIIMAEEGFLEGRFGDQFRNWAQKTPVFIPRLFGYKASLLPFSIPHVLKREHTGLLVIGLSFGLMGMVAEGWVERDQAGMFVWLGFMLLNLAGYFILRALKKQTHLLDVAGR